MVQQELTALVTKAKEVLNRNWLGASTKPSPHLYPHQWNWDSGFIAIGYARYDQRRAQRELTTLFDAQWKNGMLPQIVFNPEALGGYFPEPEFWQSERSRDCPKGVLTSGITMPPVHAIAALRVFEFAADKDMALEWLKHIYPKILALHKYLYRDRDPLREGLVYIRHPWESGMDNSPTWDPPLKAIAVDKKSLPAYQRKDLKKGIPESQRPTDDDYDRYVLLVDLFRRLNYDEKAIYEECPFLIQGPLFNAILGKANEDLMELGKILGEDTGGIEEWRAQTGRALRDKLWHGDHGAFDVFDLRANERVETRTAAGFMPLVCGAPTTEQAKRIYEFLESKSFCTMHDGGCFSIPNYDLAGDYLDTTNYWRGPVWINTNWLLMQGLKRYGFGEKTRSVREDIIELVQNWGFHEYFDPYKGKGYGTDDFSWTAALFIDAATEELEENVHETKH
jgi:hypothetical protein